MINTTIQKPTRTVLWGSGDPLLNYRAFASIDLSKIKETLKKYEGHSDETLLELEEEYRRYFSLVTAFPNRNIVPSKLVDSMWHTHILDTRAYARDCDTAIGRFVHHNPYFGGASEEQRLLLKESFYGTTQGLYREYWGEPNPSYWAQNKSDCSTESECGGGGGAGEGGCYTRCTGGDGD